MRKPSRLVQLNDIISTQILGEDAEILAIVIKIHLALEAILIEILRLRSRDDRVFRLNFPDKTSQLVSENILSVEQKKAFDLFNDFRNDFAHIFGHKISLAAALKLARDLEMNGIDFSDSVGGYSEVKAQEYYDGTLGVLSEIGWCVLFDASFCLMSNGGRDIFARASH